MFASLRTKKTTVVLEELLAFVICWRLNLLKFITQRVMLHLRGKYEAGGSCMGSTFSDTESDIESSFAYVVSSLIMQCDIDFKIMSWNFNTRVQKTLRFVLFISCLQLGCSVMLQLKMHQFLNEDLHFAS